MDDKKRAIKKFFHDYAVAIYATVFLVIILIIMMLARYGALISIQDLSKINPLITTTENELIAADNSKEMIKAPKSGKSQKTDSEHTSNTKNSSSTGAGKGSSTPVAGGNGEDDTTRADSPPFTATLHEVTPSIEGNTSILGNCTVKYKFTADISAQNPPGTIVYQWYRSDGTTTDSQSMTFSKNDTSLAPTYEWSISADSGNKYWVVFKMTSPSTQEERADVTQSCSILSL